MLTPYVNTDAPMSKKMLEALTLHEARCVFTKKNNVSENDVREFLKDEFSHSLAASFKPEFLLSSPTT